MKILLGLLLFSTMIWADNLALVDHVDSRLEWAGVPAVKVGDRVDGFGWQLGGFVEVRNDARFHQGYLPNHQWRGYAQLGYIQTIHCADSLTLLLPAGFHHESAHASMGIQESTNQAYELLYDGRYRNVNRNVFTAGLAMHYQHHWDLQMRGDYLGYVRSRNTPEGANTALTNAQGVSAGLDVSFPLSWVGKAQWRWMIGGFFRQEFASNQMTATLVHFDEPSGAQELAVNYPVFRATRTFQGSTGLSLPLGKRKVILYAEYGFGNLGGFQDSRQEITRVAGGVMLSR